ncbi:STAS domain-containing protein [candidate division KSB1 bacterium]
MKLDVVKQVKLAVIKIEDKKLDTQNSPELKTEFLKLVGEGYANILVNMENVTHADSSGLGALLFGKRQVTPLNGELKLTCLSDPALSLVKIAQLDRVFEIFDTEEEAVKSFED